MALTNVQANYGLSGIGQLTRTKVLGSAQVGTPSTIQTLTGANEGYCVRAILVGASDFVLTLATGATTGTTAFVAGTAQVETATIVAASGCTSNGDMTLVVTAAGLTGSPLNVVAPLTTTAHTTDALIATAARTALAANTAVAAMFDIGGSSAAITLTRKGTAVSDITVYPADDATVNLAIPSGLGVTAAASSADTTAGVATSGVKLYDAGVNFEGNAIVAMTTIRAMLTNCILRGSTLSMVYNLLSGAVGNSTSINTGTILQFFDTAAGAPTGTLTFSCGGGNSEVIFGIAGTTA